MRIRERLSNFWTAVLTILLISDVSQKLELHIQECLRAYSSGEKGIIETIMAIVVGSIFLIVGIYVFSVVQDVMPTPSDANLSYSATMVTSNVANAFNLLVIVFIVMAAVAILGVLLTGMMSRRYK